MIVVVDYDMGNLHSIAKALEYVGAEVSISKDPNDLVQAEKIVLPGVGAFGDGMRHLHDNGYLPILQGEIMDKKKPLLGICLGMQLLANFSEEFGHHEGLGFIPAAVVRFEVDSTRDRLKVPHVGWNNVHIVREHPLLAGIPDQADFYFVHSYHMRCTNADEVVATCDYGGNFTAMVARENIFAVQFHPEKSQEHGLKLLANFVAWKAA